MKRLLTGFAAILLLTGIAGVSDAQLTTIGTATYNGADYNLIYDADGPLGPITWLDYSHTPNHFYYQMPWAATLGSDLTVTLNPGCITDIDWTADWRLPSAGANPPLESYNVITSEMGHLFYNELGLSANPPLTTDAQLNATNFDNLIASFYWSGTEHPDVQGYAWDFVMSHGYHSCPNTYGRLYGLAVRSGQVSVVPIPAAVWLFGSGLIGLAGARRKLKK